MTLWLRLLVAFVIFCHGFIYVGGARGVAALAVFWDGPTQLFFAEGGIGALFSLVLLGAAILIPAAFR